MGVGGVGDERLTDERLIDLMVKHDRLGREAEELGRLIAAHKEMIGAAEGGAAPRRASSLAEYNRLTTESRAAAQLARSEIGEVRAREANLRRAQGEILRDLAASGMPEEVWVRHGDEGVLLTIGERGEASLRRALWEAIEESPEGASAGEVEALSRRIEARRNRSPAARAAPVVVGGVAAAASLAGFFALHWYLDPTWAASAIAFIVGVFLTGMVLFLGTRSSPY